MCTGVTGPIWDSFDDMHPPIANRDALVDGTPGVDIYPELAPAPGEHVIKKHRYSGFFGTDLDMILREWGVDTVIVSGTITESCCLATVRDAMFRNYRVIFLSDATATYNYPDRGYGAMPAADVHHAALVIHIAALIMIVWCPLTPNQAMQPAWRNWKIERPKQKN
jgi:nicotinamidase-related amidase